MIGLVNVVAAFTVRGLFPFISENEPDNAITFLLELILPEDVISPNELTLKLLNEPDKPITALLVLIIPDAVICPNELTFKLSNDADNAVIVPALELISPVVVK